MTYLIIVCGLIQGFAHAAHLDTPLQDHAYARFCASVSRPLRASKQLGEAPHIEASHIEGKFERAGLHRSRFAVQCARPERVDDDGQTPSENGRLLRSWTKQAVILKSAGWTSTLE